MSAMGAVCAISLAPRVAHPASTSAIPAGAFVLQPLRAVGTDDAQADGGCEDAAGRGEENEVAARRRSGCSRRAARHRSTADSDRGRRGRARRDRSGRATARSARRPRASPAPAAGSHGWRCVREERIAAASSASIRSGSRCAAVTSGRAACPVCHRLSRRKRRSAGSGRARRPARPPRAPTSARSRPGKRRVDQLPER